MEYDHINDLEIGESLTEKRLDYPKDTKSRRRFGKDLVYSDGEGNYLAK